MLTKDPRRIIIGGILMRNLGKQLCATLLLTLLCTCGVLAHAQQARARFFTDQSGKFKIKATIVNLNQSHVRLRKSDGTQITVEISRLSEGDQRFLSHAYEQYKTMVGDFPIGKKVEIYSSGSWHPGQVLQVQPGKFYIAFDKYSDSWNKWVTAKELRLPSKSNTDADASTSKSTASTTEKNSSPTGESTTAGMSSQISPDTDGSAAASNREHEENGLEKYPVLELEDWGDKPFPFEDRWIRTRRFVSIGGSKWLATQHAGPETKTQESFTIGLPINVKNSNVEAVVPSLNRKLALVVQGSSLTCVSLQDHSILWIVPNLPETELRPLAINDSGTRIAFAVSAPDSAPLGIRIYEIDGVRGRVTWQWRPRPDSHQLETAVSAYWLTDERLGITFPSQFEVWNVINHSQRATASYRGSSDQKPVTAISPDSSRIAILVAGRLRVFETNGMRAVGLSYWLPSGSRYVSYRPDGKEILISGGENACTINTATGAIEKSDSTELADQKLEWINQRYVLAGGEHIIDWSTKRPVWRITGQQMVESGLTLGSKLMLIDTLQNRLLVRNFVQVISPDELAKVPNTDFVTQTGTGIAFRILGKSADKYRDLLEPELLKVIENSGWKHDPNSPIVLKAIVRDVSEAMDYESMGLLGTKQQKVNVNFVRLFLQLFEGEQRIDMRGWSSLATSLGRVPRGQSLEEFVNQRSQPKFSTISKTIRFKAEIKRSDSLAKLATTDIGQIP